MKEKLAALSVQTVTGASQHTASTKITKIKALAFRWLQSAATPSMDFINSCIVRRETCGDSLCAPLDKLHPIRAFETLSALRMHSGRCKCVYGQNPNQQARYC